MFCKHLKLVDFKETAHGKILIRKENQQNFEKKKIW